MCLARTGYNIPTQWEHDPTTRDEYGVTVAMMLARSYEKIPTQWKHHPSM